MNKPGITSRFLHCVDHLISLGRVRSRRDFAIAVGYHPQGMSELGKGKRAAPIEIIATAIDIYHINPVYLFKGTGSYISDNEDADGLQLKNLSIVTDQHGDERIVHVPYPAQAGYGSLCNDAVYLSDLPTYQLPDPQFRSGTYRSFEIAGSSMEPAFRPGDIVIAAFVEPRYWDQAIKNGQVYIIVTLQDVILKRVTNRIKTDLVLECVSDNPDYEPFEIPAREIREVWKARMRITTYLDAPSSDPVPDDIRRQLREQQQLLESLHQRLSVIP